jgi:hypothetical protein
MYQILRLKPPFGGWGSYKNKKYINNTYRLLIFRNDIVSLIQICKFEAHYKQERFDKTTILFQMISL